MKKKVLKIMLWLGASAAILGIAVYPGVSQEQEFEGNIITGAAYAANCRWTPGSKYEAITGCVSGNDRFFINVRTNRSNHNAPGYATLEMPGVNTLVIWDHLDVDNNLIVRGKMGVGTSNPSGLLHVADKYSAGGKNLVVGDDIYFSDLDQANTLGIYGMQSKKEAKIQLGSGGAKIKGKSNGDICIGKKC